MSAVVIQISAQRLSCVGCGSETNATCNCGKPYKPKAADRARENKAANPDKPIKQIAREEEMPPRDVRAALRAGGGYPPPQQIPSEDDDDADHAQGLRVIAARGFLNRAVEAKNICTIEKLQPSDITEAMIDAADDAAAAWGKAARNLEEMMSHG